MAETTTMVGDIKIKAVIDNKYTKQQILKSKRYSDKQDLINALLEDNGHYTLSQVDEIINDFMKGAVK
ncbi:conserved hypothetical protein [Clostridium neonatale]|uniref:hypothetical protein n=1 Tax=Clostridium neonatale TaxID=137838 RepID=UPI00291C33FB|nr:conserved hypothetical protein [Clostridium neonatale]